MSASGLEKVYGEAVIERGKNYISNVKSCLKIGKSLHAQVHGSNLYKTKVDLNTLEGDCSCPYAVNCKHAVAAYLYYKKGKATDAGSYITGLKSLSKEELIKIIEGILPEKPEIVKAAMFRKKAKFDTWVSDFISNFSADELENIEENLDCLNFGQLILS